MNREEYIKYLIKDKGLSIKEFSYKIGIPYTTLLSMLKGSIGGASVDSVIKICKELNISVESLNNNYIDTNYENNLCINDEDEKELLNDYRKLDKQTKVQIRNFLKGFTISYEVQNKKASFPVESPNKKFCDDISNHNYQNTVLNYIKTLENTYLENNNEISNSHNPSKALKITENDNGYTAENIDRIFANIAYKYNEISDFFKILSRNDIKENGIKFKNSEHIGKDMNNRNIKSNKIKDKEIEK